MKTVMVTGYSKAPQGTVMQEMYTYTGIVLEINKETNVIHDVEYTFITDLAKDFFTRLIVGYDLSNGIDPLIRLIEEHYYGPSINSFIVALKAAYRRYVEKVGV